MVVCLLFIIQKSTLLYVMGDALSLTGIIQDNLHGIMHSMETIVFLDRGTVTVPFRKPTSSP